MDHNVPNQATAPYGTRLAYAALGFGVLVFPPWCGFLMWLAYRGVSPLLF